MNCPNCGASMIVKVLENQTILHCMICGGSFFEDNGINRITASEAEQLAHDKENDEISGDNKLCLKDQSVMKPLINQENIPTDVTLLQCPTCKSIFAYPDDLTKFKHAQETKIDYFKTWKMPLPSLSAVMVMSVIALISAATISKFIFFNNGSLSPSNAQDLIKEIHLTYSTRYMFISFKTQLAVTSEIILNDRTTQKTITKTVSSIPKTLHILTAGDVLLKDDIWYQIVVKDSNNKEIKTEWKKLEL
ncbi:MAG: hypothetical protein Q7R95_11055 [bacterium]|nr:hypothetical protein [bacterium]